MPVDQCGLGRIEMSGCKRNGRVMPKTVDGN